MTDVEKQITQLWEAGDAWRDVMPVSQAHDLVRSVIGMLDRGEVRVAEIADDVVVNEWVKLAILMWFRVQEMQIIEAGPFEYVDKLPLKKGYKAAGVRVVPGASARFGAYVDEGTMIDTWATVASCAQIGKRVHLSGGVGIGGVLEPPQAAPVIIGDDCTIGSRCMVTQGARVGNGSVLGEGVILNPGIPVIDAETGEEVARGVVPPWSIVVQAGRPRKFAGGEFSLPCALIIRRLTEGERSDKAKLNDILRDHGIST